MRFREVKLRKDTECPVCGQHPTVRELVDYDQFCGTGASDSSRHDSTVPEIQPEELKRRLESGENIIVLDVREPAEYQICNLHGLLIPLGELPQRFHELNPECEIVAHCKTGGRSAKAVTFLRDQGFQRVTNLAGGILAWANRVDQAMPKY